MGYKKDGLRLVQREFNKKLGEYDCVWREGGAIQKRTPLPGTSLMDSEDPLERFRLHLKSIR